MGNKLVTFSEEQLENYQVNNNNISIQWSPNYVYQDCTFFNRKEILR